MAFGIITKGHDDSIGVNSDWKSLVYVGKAVWTGAGSFFPADHQSYQWFRNFGPFRPSISQGPIAGTGIKQFLVRAETTTCGFFEVNLTTPNDNGAFKYYVDSPSYPHLFCNTVNSDITANILGVRNTNITGANGWPRWDITVSVSYPSGLRQSALSSITIYCFSTVYDTPGSVGFKVYNSSSALMFNSNLQPIRIKDIVTIDSTTLPNPSDLASLLINDRTLANPVVPLNSINKPAFMNIDWARYRVASVLALGLLRRLVVDQFGNQACAGLVNPTVSYSQPFIVSGLRLNSSKTARVYSLLGLDADDGVIATGTTSSTTITKTEQLPVSIPVIDGADYE